MNNLLQSYVFPLINTQNLIISFSLEISKSWNIFNQKIKNEIEGDCTIKKLSNADMQILAK